MQSFIVSTYSIETKQMFKTSQPFTEYRAENMSFALFLALWHLSFYN